MSLAPDLLRNQARVAMKRAPESLSIDSPAVGPTVDDGGAQPSASSSDEMQPDAKRSRLEQSPQLEPSPSVSVASTAETSGDDLAAHVSPISQTPAQESENEREGETGPKFLRGTYALVFGYIGAGFYGMQKQPVTAEQVEARRTIEGELEKVLYRLGAIKDANFDNFMKTHWNRVARTDKGVHAACQVVSTKLHIPMEGVSAASPTISRTAPARQPAKVAPKRAFKNVLLGDSESDTEANGVEGTSEGGGEEGDEWGDESEVAQAQSVRLFEEKLRKELLERVDPNFRLFKIYRTTKSFNARIMCCRRRYMYILPARQLLQPIVASGAMLESPAYRFSFLGERDLPTEVFGTTTLESLREDITDETFRYADPPVGKLTEEQIEGVRSRLEEVMQAFIGTHKFHNFTSRCSEKEAKLHRSMQKIRVERRTIDGEEFLAVSITGQSFLLNQIRKMVSLSVEIILGLAAKEGTIEDALRPNQKRLVHMAPAEGLFLDRVYYDWYNNPTRSKLPSRPPLTFRDIDSDMEEYKKKVILPTVVKDLTQTAVWSSWMENVRNYPYFIENFHSFA